jgi:methyltransferase (TIGR00027 family)
MSDLLKDVSDTALWVAVFRSEESQRPDALFKDPYASMLTGERGRHIAANMSSSKYTRWSIVTRTYIIDQYINELLKEGIDTVLNLGAGLDTRPYRMQLPQSLKWIEVDYPHMIELKSSKLASEKPNCQLERVSLDLGDESKRRALFEDVNTGSKKVLILTEGVTPYLSEEQVESLAKDLRGQMNFEFWLTDYFAPQIMKYMNTAKRKREMKNAPFKFNPQDYYGFFAHAGWKAHETRYITETSIALGRGVPGPWWANLLIKIFGPPKDKRFLRMYGFTLFKPAST